MHTVKTIIKHFLIFLINRFCKIRPDNVTLVYDGVSGSNTSALLKKCTQRIRNTYNINIMRDLKSGCLKEFLKREILLATSSVIVSTHGHFKRKRRQLAIELWHGFPLKGLGMMHRSIEPRLRYLHQKKWRQVDFIISYSPLFNTVMNACLGIGIEKYVICGSPRNDLLISSDARNNISKFVDCDLSNKSLVFFLPTFRDQISRDCNRENNIFDFLSFDYDRFSAFLEDLNIELFLKLHPNEEHIFMKLFNSSIHKHMHLITSAALEQKSLDLYDLLGGANILITDYSSVYFDFLLLNRPIIFTPTDISTYRDERSFLLEPYDFWTPGPKVQNQGSLEHEISIGIKNPHHYSEERNRLSDMIHSYRDFNSSERIWDFIDSQLLKREL